jgi:glycosyltransferase involved in cell wall biosynthesis
MSVYNGEHYLNEAVDSILAQTFKNIEFLIIDDASTDRTPEILHSYTDPRIKIITNKENLGLTKSLNKGLELARGEYIARMDADDISFPLRLERQVTFMDNNLDVVVCGTLKETIGNTGFYKSEFLYNPKTHERIKCSLLFGNPIAHSSAIIRKIVILEKGIRYDETFYSNQDYELWSRLINIGKFYIIPEKLVGYRKHTDNLSKRMNLKQRLDRNKKIIRQNFSMYQIPISEEQFIVHMNFINCTVPRGIASVYFTFLWIIHLYLLNLHVKSFRQWDLFYELLYRIISYSVYVPLNLSSSYPEII